MSVAAPTVTMCAASQRVTKRTAGNRVRQTSQAQPAASPTTQAASRASYSGLPPGGARPSVISR